MLIQRGWQWSQKRTLFRVQKTKNLQSSSQHSEVVENLESIVVQKCSLLLAYVLDQHHACLADHLLLQLPFNPNGVNSMRVPSLARLPLSSLLLIYCAPI